MPKKASHRVSALRMVARFLDRGGKLLSQGSDTGLLEFRCPLLDALCKPRTLGGWDSSSVEPCDWWMLQTPQIPQTHPAQFEAGESSRLTETPPVMSRPLVVFHKAQVPGEFPHLVGYDSRRESPREARERCLPGDVEVQWRWPRSVPASTNAPLWAASPGCGTFFTAAVPHIPEIEHTKCKVLGANRGGDCFKPPPAEASGYCDTK
ncbi:hypothetical protein GWK47_033708 [Chionoecetes opilio]|uniref:Uncharacterized protein n=1 Tax=Chionoecetes opilio TaxID=41210 RepID=A0A8J4YPI7_CHIOP|nr:hypothetical protein GWK47_033708 [Chionoecetes opilio]